jgi:DNA invertase Pin-like site-specific DNA recombinase
MNTFSNYITNFTEKLSNTMCIIKNNNQINLNQNKAIIYIRVSTQQQGLDAQKFICENFCDDNNLNIIKYYIEKCSAYKSNTQKELNRLIEENKNVLLIVASIDRFSRNIQQADDYIKKLEEKNIIIYSIKENLKMDTAHNKYTLRNYINMAQYESELIGERIKNNIKYKKLNNLHIGKVPYGYKIENKKIVKDLTEQSIIKFILSNYKKEKTSNELTEQLYELLKTLNYDQSYFVPLIFTLEDNEYEYYQYRNRDKFPITAQMLVNILDDYDIKKKNKPWTKSAIQSLYKNTTLNELRAFRL